MILYIRKNCNLLILNHPIQEQIVTFHLFMSTFVSFRSVLHFSCYEFCTFFVKFILTCLIIFAAVVNGVFSTMCPIYCVYDSY